MEVISSPANNHIVVADPVEWKRKNGDHSLPISSPASDCVVAADHAER